MSAVACSEQKKLRMKGWSTASTSAGAWALASDAPELPRAAAAARVSATRAFVVAAEEGIELHGGIGFTWEMDCHLFYRRARQLGQCIGSEHAWRAQLADQLTKEAA